METSRVRKLVQVARVVVQRKRQASNSPEKQRPQFEPEKLLSSESEKLPPDMRGVSAKCHEQKIPE